jgi:hypothetical protein
VGGSEFVVLRSAWVFTRWYLGRHACIPTRNYGRCTASIKVEPKHMEFAHT